MKKIRISRNDLIILYVSVLFLFIFCIFLNSVNNQEHYKIIMMPWIAVFFALEIFFLCCIKKVSYYDFGLWFIVLSNFFMFGRFVNYNLNLKDNLYITEGIYTYDDLFTATSFLVLVIFMFSLGYCFCYTKKVKYRNNSLTSNYRTLGIALCAVGFPFRLYTDLVTILYLSKVNSYTGFSDFAVPGIFYSCSALAVPGIMFLVSSFKNMNKRKLIIITIVYLVITMMLTGSRKQQIFDILSLVLFYSVQTDKKKNLVKFLSMGVFGYIFLDLIYVIREYRTNLAIIPKEFLNSISSLGLISKLIGETLGEIGLIFYSIANIVHCVPNVFNYEYGMTLLRTFLSFLPINSFVGNFFDKASSTYVINQYMNMPAGSSMFGDLYWNFGFIFGLIVSFIVGMMFSKFFNRYITISKNKITITPYYFVYFSIFMVLVRAEIIDCWRTIVYFWLISYILNKITQKKGRLWR